MVQKHAYRCDPGILSGLRINGPLAWHRAALHRVWSVHGDVALGVSYFLQLEKGAPLLARRPALECTRPFHHLQRRLLRHANFLWTHRRSANRTTTPPQGIDV